MATTTYDINVRYRLEDRASKGAKKIGGELQKTARHGRSLLTTMKVVAAGAAVGFGLRAGKKWLVDYNASLEETKLKMTGLISLNMGGTWATNQQKANSLINQFRVDAVKSAGTMQDFAEFAGMITGPILRAGMSMKDLREITKGGVVAAKAFGIEAGMAALDIEQALAGTLTKKDRFARALLEPMGIDTETWNKMAKDTPELIGENLVKAFNQPALKQMAEAYKDTWAGVTSTLKDNLQQTLGKVGLPLMQLLVKEVKSMNAYFEKNPEKIKKFIKDFSEGLVTGFGYVKDVIKLIIDNSGMLMNIAKAFVGFKLIQGAGGLLAGPFDMMSKYSKAQKLAASSTSTFANRMTSAANKMQGVATILGLVYAGASMMAGAVDREQERHLKRIEQRPQGFLSAATEGKSNEQILAFAKDAGLLAPGNEVNMARFVNAMGGMAGEAAPGALAKGRKLQQTGAEAFGGRATEAGLATSMLGAQADPRSAEAYRALMGALAEQSAQNANKMESFLKVHEHQVKEYVQAQGGLINYMRSGQMGTDIGRALTPTMPGGRQFNAITGEYEAFADPETATKPTKKNGDVKVYINTIKVTADDPDRFAMGMLGAFRSANTKPVASRIRVPGGRRA